MTVRADSGFFSYALIGAVEAHNARYSITIPQNAKVKAAVAAIGEDDWASIEYTRDGEAQVAETTIDTGRRDDNGPRTLRLVVRRSRLTGAQRELWPNWRHHAFVTDRDDLDTADADAYHRAHARVELAIRDLKDTGLRHCPSGRFSANGAWLACAALAHNITRWTARLGHVHPARQLTAAATMRQPAPHNPRPPRQPQRTPQTAPARELALAEHLHHGPATHSQPAPAHLTRRPAPRRRAARTPSATNPTAPPNPATHAPQRPTQPHTPARHQPT